MTVIESNSKSGKIDLKEPVTNQVQKSPADFASDLIKLAFENGATFAATIRTGDIPFAPELRECCTQNYCGRYATCWVGPPAVGEVIDLMDKVRQFEFGLVIQTVDQLEDSFDYEGMLAARKHHETVYQQTLAAVRSKYPGLQKLALDAGCCDICPTCTYPDEPCRFPEIAIPSVEAYGINVNPMLMNCGLKYNNGKDTVSYVGLIIF